jgi:hypothetical protein
LGEHGYHGGMSLDEAAREGRRTRDEQDAAQRAEAQEAMSARAEGGPGQARGREGRGRDDVVDSHQGRVVAAALARGSSAERWPDARG